jgi:chaperonin cofactor prefoldin
MSKLRDRNLLYTRLEEVLGAESAGILMQQLPPESGHATRSDIADLGAQIGDIAGRVDGLESRMDNLDTRMDNLDTRMDNLDTRMERMERHMERFDDRLHDFHGALREQTRHFILASTGAMVALTGVAFGAASLI